MRQNIIQHTSSIELMRKAKEGVEEAFTLLYKQYFVPVFQYIYYRIQSKEEAEDLTQAVFLKVYQSISRFEDRGVSPKAYFFTVARNIVIDYWRKKKYISLEETDDIESKKRLDNPEEFVIQGEAKAQIGEALNHITSEQKEVIVLKFINDLSTQEIARLLGKTEEAIRQLQCRGLKALRLYLKKYEHD